MTKIIAFSGRKQAGKDTCCQIVDRLYRQKNRQLCRQCPDCVKTYSFAYYLKWICKKVLGLTDEQVNGTDKQKNSMTPYRWEDMPGVVTDFGADLFNDVCNAIENPLSFPSDYSKLVPRCKGNMTSRDLLQFVGTEIFRRMNENIWADSTIRQIKKEMPSLALISDMRFRSEFNKVKNAGGLVIRLTRNGGVASNHTSETELDRQNFSWSNFDAIIDNENMSLREQEEELKKVLLQLEVI